MHRRKGDDGEPSEQDGQATPSQTAPSQQEEEKVHSKGSSKGLLVTLLFLGLALGGAAYMYYGKSASSDTSGNKAIKPKKGDIFTKEELKLYDGSNPELPIYLAIIGEVFDVTRGKQYYGPGGGYAFFAGVDGTRAFVTGEFNETGLVESVAGLPVSQVNDIQGWRDFYHKDYIYKGKLIGHYYDKRGKPTKNHAKFQELLKQHQAEAEVKKAWENKYPACNSKWEQNAGSEVWCADQSGGISRGWAGVPRLYVGPDFPQRCVCIEESALASVSENDFQVYPNCDPLSPLCRT